MASSHPQERAIGALPFHFFVSSDFLICFYHLSEFSIIYFIYQDPSKHIQEVLDKTRIRTKIPNEVKREAL